MHRVRTVGKLRRRTGKQTATEVVLLQPFLQPIKSPQHRGAWFCVFASVIETLANFGKTRFQSGDDQLVLGFEVVVEGHFCHVRLGQNAVDAGGVVADAVKQRQGGFNQLLAFACCHVRPPECRHYARASPSAERRRPAVGKNLLELYRPVCLLSIPHYNNMSDMVMRLYDMELSGNCYKVRLFLSLIGQRAELHSVDILGGEHRGKAYLAINPRGLLPALEDDGQTLIDSQAI